MNITIGCDPEFFVRKKHGSRAFVSAHGLIPGSKEYPHKVDGGAVQVDGMAVEVNTDPTSNAVEFAMRIGWVLDNLNLLLGDKYEICIKPWSRFGKKVWDGTPDEAKILGCDPDFNAYTGVANVAPNAEADFRTAAGHVHIGWTKGVDINDAGHYMACRTLVQELDVQVGLLSVLLDGSSKRRELYGKAGAFRPKSYGAEYRTPSNFWLKSNSLQLWMFNQTQNAVDELLVGRGFSRLPCVDTSEVRLAIDTSNTRLALDILERTGLLRTAVNKSARFLKEELPHYVR